LKMRIRNPSGETAMQNGKWLKEISLWVAEVKNDMCLGVSLSHKKLLR
jgi:hypothetical protein